MQQKSSKITIAAAQFDVHIFDKEYNVATICRLAKTAHEQHGANIVVCPEASVTGYCFTGIEEVSRVAIQTDGDEIKKIKEQAAKLNVSIVFAAVEKAGEEYYNTAFFVEPDGTMFCYRKTHLPFLGLDKYVAKGNDLSPFESRFGKLGMIICYDLRFPEPSRVLALKGARLIIQPTNLPVGGESHFDYFGRSRACENRVHLISCNRCGEERGFKFIGRSQIIDYTGKILCEAGTGEEVISAEVDLELSEHKDIIVTPGEYETHIFTDRRYDLFGSISTKPDAVGFVGM